MTVQSRIRDLGIDSRPAANGRRPGRISRTGGDEALSLEQQSNSFATEFAQVLRFHNDNSALLQNQRTRNRQNPTGIRIISNVGYNQLRAAHFMPSWDRRISQFSRLEGLPDGRGEPVFRYIAPKVIDNSIRPFRDGINFVVMHSFGETFDAAATARRGTHTVRIDPATGHNPRRFANGVNTLVNPGARGPRGTTRATIHHMVSLRGDLVNSVSWDSRCIHGAGGQNRNPRPPERVLRNANDYSIGIEHEEWFIRRDAETRIRRIEDHGPYSEEQYTIDAFILKKLEAYTGQNFRVYLGNAHDGLWDRILNRTVGCFNHRETSTHGDPGAEYALPPDFELRVTSIRARSSTATNRLPAKWEERFRLWWSDVPTGSKISAYARIFEKMERMRSFNVQTEVFNPALGRGPIDLGRPTITGSYTVAAAQRAARDRLNSTDRAQQMQSADRSGLYSAAQSGNAAIRTAITNQTGRLGQITEQSLRLPVIINALGFDYARGLWVNGTTENSRTAAEVTADVTTVDTNPTADAPEPDPDTSTP